MEWIAAYKHPLFEPYDEFPVRREEEEQVAADRAWEEEQRRIECEKRVEKNGTDLSMSSAAAAFLECEREQLWSEPVPGKSDPRTGRR